MAATEVLHLCDNLAARHILLCVIGLLEWLCGLSAISRPYLSPAKQKGTAGFRRAQFFYSSLGMNSMCQW